MQKPVDYQIMLYLAKRLRWARRDYRRMRSMYPPEKCMSNFWAMDEARNAYYGAKETYLRGRGRYPE